MAGVKDKEEKRVWIDSQTEEEILKGIETAKDLSEYDNLCEAAYLRAKEDYLMGINFSRVLTLKYGRNISNYLKMDRAVVSVGRVMTCVLGMVVRREREIRAFVKTPFFKVIGKTANFDAEWRVCEQSKYYNTPYLYKDNGFVDKEKAQELVTFLSDPLPAQAVIEKIERKKETKNPPLLFNLAEIQNECAKQFKISPDETLNIIQELYEKKLVTYPRTDARVLSTAVCKEIHKNIGGLKNYQPAAEFAGEILEKQLHKNIAKTRYCDDKKITDHYAIIPTGQGLSNLNRLSQTAVRTYELIVRRFLSIFYPAAQYSRVSITSKCKAEAFYATFKVLTDEGYLKIVKNSFSKPSKEDEDGKCTREVLEALKKYKKGDMIDFNGFEIKEGETSPPKRYNSGSMILAMENAGKLTENEDLRAQIKNSGIGTSSPRAEILKKLNTNKYISTNKKTQVLTPTLMGEVIYDATSISIPQLLNPAFTASWEKGLNFVSNGVITSEEYMQKLTGFIDIRTRAVIQCNNKSVLMNKINELKKYYKNIR